MYTQFYLLYASCNLKQAASLLLTYHGHGKFNFIEPLKQVKSKVHMRQGMNKITNLAVKYRNK